jgi:CspA family cold shock protein
MEVGTVIWLHPTRGFGFIKPDYGDSDFYVHAQIFRECGIAVPLNGQRIRFEVGEYKGRRAAVNIKMIAR